MESVVSALKLCRVHNKSLPNSNGVRGFFFSVRWYWSFKGKYTGCIASLFSKTTSRLSLGLNKCLRSKWNTTTLQFRPEYQLQKPVTTWIVIPSWLSQIVNQSVTSLCGELNVYSWWDYRWRSPLPGFTLKLDGFFLFFSWSHIFLIPAV